RDNYEYERTFTITDDTLKMNSINLVCEGLDTLTELKLNGHLVATTDNMHRRYKFDIRNYLISGENKIRILIKSPVQFIEKAWAEKNDIWGICAKDGYQYIRKAHYMYGWDWGPAIPDGGIWRDIYIESYNHGSIEQVYISQHHKENSVKLIVLVEINKFSDKKLTLKGSVTSPRDECTFNLSFNDKNVSEIIIENPLLWWPAGYGQQPLYNVKIELLADGETEDTSNYKIGLRTLGIKREKDQWGESFAYEINGIEIFAKGANYIPEDNILARCSRERTESLIKHAVDANFNSLRVWGGGIYPEDYFFDLCDEYGIMVWQDFMFASAQYVLDDQFVKTIEAEIKDNIRRLRHHPSIALWCGNNEMEWLWMDTQTKGRSKAQMDEYLELFEGIIPPIAAKEDPDRFYWPASPSSGGNFDDPNAQNRGDVHYWDVWHGLKPFSEYRKFFFRFCSEFGFQSFPCLKTVQTYTLPEDRNIFSYIMESHQKNDGANGKILYYLSENFKNPKNFESLLYVSQLLQAEAIKYGVEHWRRNRGRCMGSIYWQYNDCWPVASWSSVDSYHRWKALHYFAKRFYSPVLLSAEDDGLKVSLHLSNESLNKISGNVSWKLIHTDGNPIDEGTLYYETDALTSNKVIDLDYTTTLKDMDIRRSRVLIYEFIADTGEITGSSLLFVPNKYFRYKKPVIKVAAETKSDIIELTLTADTYAGYVELMPLDVDCVFSDNYFSLPPGTEKKVTVNIQKYNIDLTGIDFMKQLQIRSIADSY
ncbi:MAG: glycoside hydrolase family 2 protein, partial [Clostridiales bacterium]|nr:glycoside hydrolase family 2 protein [Clostridiales bacterium]